MTKEQTIQHYMAKLDLTHDEAEQMWLDEQNDNLPDLTQEQKQVEKEMRRSDRKKETTSRQRERKIDKDKRFLIDYLNSFLIDLIHRADLNALDDNVLITNPEREITFNFKGEKYQLTLVKKRKEKN